MEPRIRPWKETTRFGHWLVRQIGYEAMLIADRRVLHRRVAEAIEAQHDLALSDDELREESILDRERAETLSPSAVELGHHWEMAGAAGRGGLFLLLAAQSCQKKSRYDEALALSSRGMRLLKTVSDRLGCAAVAVERGAVLERLSRYEEGLAEYGGAAVAASARKGESAAWAMLDSRASTGLGSVLQRLGRYEEGREATQAGLEAARTAGDRKREAVALNSMGNVHLSRGEVRDALARYEESLTIMQQLGDRLGQAALFNNIGNMRRSGGDHQEALRLCEEALVIVREIGDRWGQAVCLNTIGVSYDSRGDYEDALRLHQESLAIRREIGDRWGQVASLGNIGAAHLGRGEYRDALRVFDEAVGLIAQGTGVREFLCEILASRAVARLRLGDRPGGAADAERALIVADGIGYTIGRLNALAALSLCQSDEKLAESALEEGRASGQRQFVCETLLLLAEIRERAGNTDGARAAAAEAASLSGLCNLPNLVRRAEELAARLGNAPQPSQ